MSNAEALYGQVLRRMLETGEWNNVQTALVNRLNEAGWVDDLKHQARSHSEDTSESGLVRFQTLLKDLTGHAQSSVPLSVKQEISAMIRAFLEKQLEG